MLMLINQYVFVGKLVSTLRIECVPFPNHHYYQFRIITWARSIKLNSSYENPLDHWTDIQYALVQFKTGFELLLLSFVCEELSIRLVRERHDSITNPDL